MLVASWIGPITSRPSTNYLSFALPASDQERQGRDTPGEWIIDHFQSFGLRDSICDHRITGELREERCYVRYVDVFSPRPKFAAQFLFLTPGPEVEFGLERGTRLTDGGFRIERRGAITWQTERRDCLRRRECDFTGDLAIALVEAMRTGEFFLFNFRDRHGETRELRWDLSPFASAFEDFRTEAAARSL